MTTRIANLAANKLIQSTLMRTQERITDRQLQISTLQKSQDYAGISDESHRLVTLEASRRRTDQFINEASNVKLRMESMLNSLNSLKTTLKDVRGFISEVLDDGTIPDGVDKDEFAAVKSSEITDFLNVRVAGRYLFAGSLTETKPVELGDMSTAPTNVSTLPAFDTVAEPAFYYQGDQTKIKARIDEGLEIQYGVTADNPAFEKLVRAVRIIRSTAENDANIIAKYQEAQQLVIEAQEAMQAVELNVGTKLEQLGRTTETLQTTRNFFNGIVSDLESADTFTAVAELTQDQTMLEASYNVLVRLSNLSLTKYLGV